VKTNLVPKTQRKFLTGTKLTRLVIFPSTDWIIWCASSHWWEN